jgi:hypothetical protein
MATNYFKVAYDKFALILKTAYPQFKKSNALLIRDVVTYAELGREETILLTPFDDSLLGDRTGSTTSKGGRSDEYTLMLRYYRTMNILDYDKLTAAAENIIDTTLNNKHTNGYWHYIGVDTLEYIVDVPVDAEGEPMKNVYGFTMSIKIRLDKYA